MKSMNSITFFFALGFRLWFAFEAIKPVGALWIQQVSNDMNDKSFSYNGWKHKNALSSADKLHNARATHSLSRTALYSDVGSMMEPVSDAMTVVSDPLDSDNLVQELLDMARRLGPVGIRNSIEDQEKIMNLAELLQQRVSDSATLSTETNFTDTALTGVHELIYSAAPGGSSGKIGPFDGKVTQTFVNETSFVNAVDLGPLRIALFASRKIKDARTIAVRFLSTTISLFGIPIVTKTVGGGGIWSIMFTRVVNDMNDKENPKRLLRVMQTPSLFIIEQRL